MTPVEIYNIEHARLIAAHDNIWDAMRGAVGHRGEVRPQRPIESDAGNQRRGAGIDRGIGDFLGGFKTRRLGAFAVLFVSQPPTLLLIGILVIVRGVPARPGPWIVAGVVAGLAGLVGLSAAYRGMAIGVISVVSTIAATGPVVPILVGLVLGERPTALQFVGMAMTLGGIALLAVDRRPSESGRRLLPGVGLALLAAGVLKGRRTAAYPALQPDVEAAGAEFVNSEAVIDGTMVSARAWPDNPAWMRAFISLLKEKAPVQKKGMAAR